ARSWERTGPTDLLESPSRPSPSPGGWRLRPALFPDLPPPQDDAPMMRNLLWVVPGFLSLLLAGCGGESGPPTASVKGKVSLDGKPLPIGTVMFRPEKGPIASGVVDENG